MTEIYLGCLPADTPQMRARLHEMGLLEEWLSVGGGSFVPAYAGSTEGSCDSCGLAIHIGPEQQKLIREHGEDVIKVCLVCTCLEALARGIRPDDIQVQPLTDKKWGE